MRKRSCLSSLLAAALLLTLLSSVGSAAASKKETRIQSYVSAMQPGWNLGNTLEAIGDDETAWGNPYVTKQFIKEIKKQGFKSIRIPVSWKQRMGDGPDYIIDPAFLNRLQEVVDWSLDEGLYVMINIHDAWLWMRSMGTEHDEVLARFQAIWKQVADRFIWTAGALPRTAPT